VGRSTARNVAVQVAGHALALALGTACVALVARYLGVAAYGTYMVATSVTAVVTGLAGTTLDPLSVRSLARGDGEDGELLRRLLGLRLVAGTVLGTAVAAGAWIAPLGGGLRLGLSVAAVGIVVSGVQATAAAALQARLRFGSMVAFDFAVRCAVTALYALIVLVLPRPEAESGRVALAVGIPIGATLLVLPALARFLRAQRLPLGLAFDRATWRSVAVASAPLALVAVLGVLNYRMDVVVLAALADDHAVGIYGVAVRFVDAILPLGSFLVAALFPLLARAAAGGQGVRRHVQAGLDTFALVAPPAALGAFLLVPFLVRTIAGEQYSAAALPLRILVLSLPFTFAAMLCISALLAADRHRDVGLLAAAGVAANLALNVLLVPRYTYTGSAVATLVTEIGGSIVLLALVRRRLGVRLSPRIPLGAAAAGAAMVAVAAPLAALSSVLGIAVSAALYGALVLGLRLVTVPQLKLLVGGT
jgi:O-antigen/teichoic acid export membrane protein